MMTSLLVCKSGCTTANAIETLRPEREEMAWFPKLGKHRPVLHPAAYVWVCGHGGVLHSDRPVE